MARQWQRLIREYADWLPFDDGDLIVTLKEGGTPLAHARTLDLQTGASVYVKAEGANPTGSFEDRGMTTAISQVLTADAKVVTCTSMGNTSASAAAYAAAAGLSTAVTPSVGKIAAGKFAQAIVHGAILVAVDGNFNDCLRIVRKLTKSHPVAFVNSVNSYRLQGQKAAAFETVGGLGDAPDIHVFPVGNAGNISAYWMGYCEYAGRIALTSMACTVGATPASAKIPQVWGVQAWGVAPLVLGYVAENPETVIIVIRIGNPASWKYTEAVRGDSRGRIDRVTDEQTLQAQSILAVETGIFVESGPTASIAGLLQVAEQGKVSEDVTIVYTAMGNGLEDTATVLEGRELPFDLVAPTLGAVASALGL